MIGWVKLQRQLLTWEWFKTTNMVHLFVYLLLKANHTKGLWQGIEIQRGQLITGIKSLQNDTNISQQTLRTCLKRLQKTEEINIQSTNKYSIITIINYESYQDEEITTNKQPNKQLTSNQQATNKQLTTNNNNKELKNNKNNKEYKELLLSEINISDFTNINQKYFEITLAFYELFKNNLTEAGATLKNISKAKGTWIDEIRLIIETDKYTIEDLQQVYSFLQINDFWKKNILSTSKLRKQMDNLKLQIKNGINKGNNQKRDVAELAGILHKHVNS
jgi:hypothetical protein